MPAFFDSNVLLYLVQDDDRKAEIAEEMLREGGRISVQVLNEIAYVCRRKFRYDWSRTTMLLNDLQALLVVDDLSVAVHRD